ncbi:hypothetical protein C8F04DRAFT_1274784 [Mycena alexandri]|uniref:F-box domain-containing protein n=1 Tax=Mycena alexandri TaxID=1745969 RepID=A0AAD6WN60_9AGAR|nr:hypothetical protein C8F04DRAFT_1274784 [Mycena alexandri]
MSLPAELRNLIFDECISSNVLIATWGLVSKDHVVSSRSHLFSAVHLNHTNANKFAEIMVAPSCDIASQVNHLVLSNRADRPWFSDVLPRLPKFPHLASLCLHNSKSLLPEDIRNLLHDNLPAVKTLEIVNFKFAYRSDAIEFACEFSQLEALTFFPKVAKRLPAATRAQIPTSLRALVLRCGTDEQPNWFLADLGQPSAPKLTTLRIREAGARDFSVVSRALASQGASLECLTLDFSDTAVEVAYLRNPILHANTRLRRLELTLGGAAVIAYCASFLAHTASPMLEEIILDIWIDPAHFAAHPWEALDTVIAGGPPRTALKLVKLRVGTLFSWSPLADNIRRRMPLCDESGVLKVRVDDGQES